MPLVDDFWEWTRSGGGIPSSLGVGLVGHGGSINTYIYDLTAATYITGPNFLFIDEGGAMTGNTVIALHWTNNVATQFLEKMTWSSSLITTAATSSGIGTGVNLGSQSVAASNATLSYWATFSHQAGAIPTTALFIQQSWKITYSTLALSAGAFSPTFFPSYGFQCIGGATKGYFYSLSVDFATSVQTANDGPPTPVAYTTFHTVSYTQCGAGSNSTQALTQYFRTFGDTQFSSQLYTFSTATASTGPLFSAVFPPGVPAQLNKQAASTAISGTSSATFFETYDGTSTHLSNTEIYIWASAAVVAGVAAPIFGTTNPFYPIAGNSNPGYL